MKVFENKSIFKKLMIVFLFILIVSFCVPKIVRAGGDDDAGIGGKLLNPVLSMFVGLGDSAMSLMQKYVFDMDTSLINIDTSAKWWAKLIVVFTAIVSATVFIVANVVTAGGISVVLAVGMVPTILKIGLLTAITFPVTTGIVEGMLPDSFDLPLYSITPQEIFSNQIPLLDVDFFNPSEGTEGTRKVISKESKYDSMTNTLINKHGFTSFEANLSSEEGTMSTYEWEYNNKNYTLKINRVSAGNGSGSSSWTCYWTEKNDDNKNYVFGGIDNQGNAYPESITDTDDEVITEEEVEVEKTSTAKELQSTISNWYVILRDISLVVLLSVLVYIGIRILISSTSNDKAKYKQMLVDWVVAICLLFVMHYIMSFANILVKKIIEIVDSTSINVMEQSKNDEEVENVERPEIFVISDSKKVEHAYKTLIEKQIDNKSISDKTESPYYYYFRNADMEEVTKKSDAKYLLWPAENFMQQARLKLQLLDDDHETYEAIGWKLIFIVLVVYTFIFMFTYLKRVVYMAFLTLIAPLVALTYPIDKMNDGKAQAFNAWFKEYMFNLLIQPMHLILYTILISSAMDFASQNILYVIVALGFMVPAEKLMRSFFGFEKAHTPGFLAGPAGAAVMMNGMNKLLGRGPKKGGKISGANGNDGNENDDSNSTVRENSNLMDVMADANTETFNDDETPQNLNDGGESDRYEEYLNDIQNPEPVFDNREDPALEDYNYMYMHPDEYDDNGNWLGNQVSGTDLENGNPTEEDDNGNWLGNQVSETDLENGNPTEEDANMEVRPDTMQIGTTQQNNGSQLSRRQKIAKAISVGARTEGRRLVNKAKNGHYIRKGLGVATGLAGAGMFAVAGGIAGIASGDVSKGIQYATTGAVGGYKIADGIPNRIVSSYDKSKAHTQEIARNIELELYGKSGVKQRDLDKKVQRARENDKFNQQLLEQLGSQEKVNALKETKYFEKAIRHDLNAKEIVAGHKMIQEGAKEDEIIAIAQYVHDNGRTDKDNISAKESDELNNTLKMRASKNSKIPENKVEKIVKNTRDKMDKFSSYL